MAASRVKWKPGLWNNQQYDAPLSGGISLPHGDGAIPWNIGKGPGDVAWVTASGTTLVLIRCFFFFFFFLLRVDFIFEKTSRAKLLDVEVGGFNRVWWWSLDCRLTMNATLTEEFQRSDEQTQRFWNRFWIDKFLCVSALLCSTSFL